MSPSASTVATDDAAVRVVRDRSLAARVWYEAVRLTASSLLIATGGLRATGRHHVPREGGVLLVANHLSNLDPFVLGIPTPRQLNYVARSTLFFPPLGPFIRSVGSFPIQRDGMGAAGVKETLRRARKGGVVLLFPEGTRSRDGRLAEIKPGISALALRARVPIVPAGVAGTFEAWPRFRPFPLPHAVRIVYGRALPPEEIAGHTVESLTALISERLRDCHREALLRLARDLGTEPTDCPSAPRKDDLADCSVSIKVPPPG